MANKKIIYDEALEQAPMQPPEPEYLSAKFKVNIPVNDPHFDDKWDLRKYAAKLVENKVGDEVQVTDMRVKMPGAVKKFIARLLGRTPEAKLYLTVKF
jgi:hypothetical protein